jgi:predicted lysophospholipase L1 biosynthesis ABC-type transport system permease subunit
MDAIGKDIGERVTVQSTATKHAYEIVGQQALPSGATFDTPVPMADNAGLSEAGFRALMSEGEQNGNFNLFAELAPGRTLGTDRDPNSGYPLVAEKGYAVTPTIPAELDRMQQVDPLPLLLGAFLAFLGMTALTHALLTSARRRGRDIAILRAIGFRRRQVRASIAWQATALALVGLVIGVPIGVLLGRAVWTTIAEALGVGPDTSTPLLAMAAIGVATLLVVNVIALVAARRPARVSPADVLAAE